MSNSIITFHAVANGLWFDHLICFLKSHYHLQPLESVREFYDGALLPDNSCHIAVDDGDRSFYDVIFPILVKHRVPASLFVSPRMCAAQSNFWFQEIEGYDQCELRRICVAILGLPAKALEQYAITSILKTMTNQEMDEAIVRYQSATKTPKKACRNIRIDELVAIDKSGLVSIGAHTICHPILKNEDDLTSRCEVVGSIEELAELLGHEVKYFAYPNGIPSMDFTEREEGYLLDSGVQLAFTTESRHLALSDCRMRIPRIQVSDNESSLAVNAKLLLGSSWNALKRLKRGGEYAERIQLEQLIC